jgi:methyl-accepting chemotaxis protein
MEFRRHSEKNDASCSSKNGISFFDVLKSEAKKSYTDIITENCQKSDSDIDNEFVSNGLHTVDKIKQMTDHNSASLKELMQKYGKEIETLRKMQIPEIEEKLKEAKQELKRCTEEQIKSYKEREDLVSKQLASIKSSYVFYMRHCVGHAINIKEHLRAILTLLKSKDAKTTIKRIDRTITLPRQIKDLSSRLGKLCYSSDELENLIKCGKDINELITKFEKKMIKFTNDIGNLIKSVKNLPIGYHTEKDLIHATDEYHKNRQEQLESLEEVAKMQKDLAPFLDNYSKATDEYSKKVKNVKCLELELKSSLWLKDDLERKSNNVESNYNKLLSQTYSPAEIHLKPEHPSKSASSSFTPQEKDPFCDEDDYFPVLKSEAGKSSTQIILENYYQNSHKAIDNEFISNGLHTVDEIKAETDHNSESLKGLIQKYDKEIETLEKMQIPEAKEKLKKANKDFKVYEKEQMKSRRERERLVSKQSTLIKNACDHYMSFCVGHEKDIKKYLNTILKLLQSEDAKTTFKQIDHIINLPRKIRELSSQLDNLHSLSGKLKNSIKCGKTDTDKLITNFEKEMTNFINDISNLRKKAENLLSSSQTCKLLESTIQEYHKDRKEYLEALKAVDKARSNLSSLLFDYRLATEKYLKKADDVKYWRANLKELLWRKEDLERKRNNVDSNYNKLSGKIHLETEATLESETSSSTSGEDFLLNDEAESSSGSEKEDSFSPLNNKQKNRKTREGSEQHPNSYNLTYSPKSEYYDLIYANVEQEDYLSKEALEKELQRYTKVQVPSTDSNCLLYALMMAAGHDLNKEDILKQVGESINKIRTFLEEKHRVEPDRMLDPVDKSVLIAAIQHLQKEYTDLGQFTNLVIYTANERHRTNETESLWYKTTIPLSEDGNKSLHIYYDGRGEVGHYYALFPKNPAQPETLPSQNENSSQPETLPSQNENPSQPETLPKSETSSSSNATQSKDDIWNWYPEDESIGWCSIQ